MKKISEEKMEQTRQFILDTICSKSLTHAQKVHALAGLADSLMDVLDKPAGLDELMDKRIICDLGEGNAPLRPRYIVPDYELFFKQGSKFLQLDPPTDLYEALNSLLILYRNVPSVTDYPVFIGKIDRLLEPFVMEMPYNEAKKLLRLFLINVDRTVPDAFCHMDIGPEASLTGKIILELERELQNAVPNLTLLYDPEITPDEFACEAIKTQLAVAKPAFANHPMYVKDLGEDYAIVSCYNSLPIGGGAYTLVRVLLGHLAETADNKKDFFDRVLPNCMDIMGQFMDERVRFIVEDSNFFESNFLAREGLIHQDRFTAMFGMVGLAQCANVLMEKEGKTGRYGHSEEADQIAIEVMEALTDYVDTHENKYCGGYHNRFMLHGQVGIDTDIGQTANCRIPIGEEPVELSDHLMHCAKFQKYFPAGVGEIFPVESTAMNNPSYQLDIIKGAFANDVRYVTFHSSEADVIRVTGYLVKRSEVEKLRAGECVQQGTTAFGMGAFDNSHILDRKER